MNLPEPPILIITDRTQCPETLEKRAVALFEGGCRWLSLREKDLAPADRLTLLERLIDIGSRFGATVGVHSDLATAQACGAALHLSARSNIGHARRVLGDAALIGKSCHDLAEITAALVEGADYATLSPIFISAGKPGYPPMPDSEASGAIDAGKPLPVLALGGVTHTTLPLILGTGFGGVAILGEAMTAPDPEKWFRGMHEIWARREP